VTSASLGEARDAAKMISTGYLQMIFLISIEAKKSTFGTLDAH
jgi:hypothetical protein